MNPVKLTSELKLIQIQMEQIKSQFCQMIQKKAEMQSRLEKEVNSLQDEIRAELSLLRT